MMVLRGTCNTSAIHAPSSPRRRQRQASITNPAAKLFATFTLLRAARMSSVETPSMNLSPFGTVPLWHFFLQSWQCCEYRDPNVSAIRLPFRIFMTGTIYRKMAV